MDNIYAVVVTYNRKDILTKCIDAILTQSHPVSKLVIIDNNSTDGTEEYLKEMEHMKMETDSNLTENHQNQKIMTSWNVPDLLRHDKINQIYFTYFHYLPFKRLIRLTYPQNGIPIHTRLLYHKWPLNTRKIKKIVISNYFFCFRRRFLIIR